MKQWIKKGVREKISVFQIYFAVCLLKEITSRSFEQIFQEFPKNHNLHLRTLDRFIWNKRNRWLAYQDANENHDTVGK